MVFYNPESDGPPLDPEAIARKLESAFTVNVNADRGQRHAQYVLQRLKELQAPAIMMEDAESSGSEWVVIEVACNGNIVPLLVQPSSRHIRVIDFDTMHDEDCQPWLPAMIERIGLILGFDYDDQC